MRSIPKTNECLKLKEWKRSNSTSTQNLHYDNLVSNVRKAILEKLYTEQGGLCAYTMMRIPITNNILQAHIEHILPRSLHPTLTLDWNNLVACVPVSGASIEFGAQTKANYDPVQNPFVNPTKGGVSSQFKFTFNGLVQGKTPDSIASISEEVLHLNHPHLINDRRSKIQAVVAIKPTANQLRKRSEELRKPDQAGMLEPYCEAVAQVLENFASNMEKKSSRVVGLKR